MGVGRPEVEGLAAVQLHEEVVLLVVVRLRLAARPDPRERRRRLGHAVGVDVHRERVERIGGRVNRVELEVFERAAPSALASSW